MTATAKYPLFGEDPRPRPRTKNRKLVDGVLVEEEQPHEERLPGFLETPPVVDVEKAQAGYARAVQADTRYAFGHMNEACDRANAASGRRRAPEGGPR